MELCIPFAWIVCINPIVLKCKCASPILRCRWIVCLNPIVSKHYSASPNIESTRKSCTTTCTTCLCGRVSLVIENQQSIHLSMKHCHKHMLCMLLCSQTTATVRRIQHPTELPMKRYTTGMLCKISAGGCVHRPPLRSVKYNTPTSLFRDDPSVSRKVIQGKQQCLLYLAWRDEF